MDQTVRLYDCRGGTQRDVGTIDIVGGKSALAVDWCRNTASHALLVTGRDGQIVVYDKRKLSISGAATSSISTTAISSGNNNNNNSTKEGVNIAVAKVNPAILHIIEPQPREEIGMVLFGPGSGKHLIASSQLHEFDTTSDLCVWDWTQQSEDGTSSTAFSGLRFPAHTESIFTMALSRDDHNLATGGADAIVGIWDTRTMTMLRAVGSRSKVIRSVAFSHDGEIVAHSNEEDGVELVGTHSGKVIGQVSLGPRGGGAEQIEWHPTHPILACAREERSCGNTVAPVVISRISLSMDAQ